MKRKNKKLKIKKAYSGDFMTAETSSSMYDSGRAQHNLFKIVIRAGTVDREQILHQHEPRPLLIHQTVKEAKV